MAAQKPNGNVQREVLPIPDIKPVGLTTYDAKDPETNYPPIKQLRPPEGAPNGSPGLARACHSGGDGATVARAWNAILRLELANAGKE